MVNLTDECRVDPVANTYPRFEPILKLDDMRVVEALEHLQLVEDHALVAPDVLLQDDLDGNSLAIGPICLSDNPIGPRAEGPPKTILGPENYMLGKDWALK